MSDPSYSSIWTEEYSVNIKLFDLQHERLVLLICRLEAAMKAGLGSEQVMEIASDLADYCGEHFATEEAVMKAYDFPWRDRHALEHRRFLATIADLQTQSRSGERAVSVTLLDQMKEWLCQHVLGSDKQYTEHLNARGMF
jgi:hemerythrin-like metal-binding protein